MKLGFINIARNEPYDDHKGYGFDFVNIDQIKVHSEKNGYCSAHVPFYFSAKFHEGAYEVLVSFGVKKYACNLKV